MTLIVSVLAGPFAFQVSDRLVTKTDGNSFWRHDEESNKAVIFRARDALVCIGYTGRAYAATTPFDQWVAELLAGYSASPMLGVRLRGAQLPRGWPDIFHAAEKLRSSVAAI